jgi:hypothetical protein
MYANFKYVRSLTVVFVAWFVFVAPARPAEAEWISLFDGRTLQGWRAAESPRSFRVADGAIVTERSRGHLFYVGADRQAEFENFELEAEVWAAPGSNSGIYFHTRWQRRGWPEQGLEVQVNNSAKQHGNYLELKKTGSLYGLRNVYPQLVPDNTWFTVRLRVQRPRVQVHINDVLTVDYIEPALPLPDPAPEFNQLGRGTFALQAHDPDSRVLYRNLRVRHLPPGEDSSVVRPQLDPATARRLALGRANFPLLDLNTRQTTALTLGEGLAFTRHSGINLGIVARVGAESPVKNDSEALAFLAPLRSQPVFIGLYGEGRDWIRSVSADTLARFDYISSDATMWTDQRGHRVRLRQPEEAHVGSDIDAFMEELVDQTVQVISSEPIDVLAYCTYLPERLEVRAAELWTEPRMRRVIGAAVEHGVALEINPRLRLPSERFVRMARDARVKFVVGTDAREPGQLEDWTYVYELIDQVGLEWRNMWVPGHQPTRAQRAAAR